MANIMHVEVTLDDNGNIQTFVLDNTTTTTWKTVIIGEHAKDSAPNHEVEKDLKFRPKEKSGAELEVAPVAVMTKEPDVCTWDGTRWVCSGS